MKQQLNRFLSLLIALTICTTLFSVSASAATKDFSDVPSSHWAHAQIAAAVEDGIAAGYEDGTFKPGNSVTKAQFAVMLSRAFFPDDIKKNQANADGQAWYWANLKTLADRGLLYGTVLADESSWASRGGVSITRYEMAQLMNSILGAFGKTAAAAQKSAAQNAISDWRFISPDYQDAVATCYALGVLNGQADGTFGGNNSMNRAQGCVVIARLKDYIANGKVTTPSTSSTPAEEKPGQVVQEPEPTKPVTSAKTLANGKEVTEENVLEILEELKEEYPEGSSWGANDRYTSAVLGSGRECAGYAFMISDKIFGALPQRTHKNYFDIKPGDIIEQKNSSGQTYHWSVVSTSPVDSDGYFRTTGGNVSGGLVTWDGFGTSEAMEDEGYSVIHTRYPA